MAVDLLVVASASLLAVGRAVFSEYGERFANRLIGKIHNKQRKESPTERLQRLSEKLFTTSREFDTQLRELEKLHQQGRPLYWPLRQR